jgi:ankyrin repeat protein
MDWQSQYGGDMFGVLTRKTPMRTRNALTLLALSLSLFGCDKKEASTANEPASNTVTGASMSMSAEPTKAAVKDTKKPTPEEIGAFLENAFNGNTEAVTSALKNGMSANQKDENGFPALFVASFNGQVETMKALLDAGADVNLRNPQGVTPLMAACGPYPKAVRLLLENGADVNATDNIEDFTALMYAATEGLSPVVDILLEAGADPSMKDVDDDTAGNFAEKSGFKQLADKLHALEK